VRVHRLFFPGHFPLRLFLQGIWVSSETDFGKHSRTMALSLFPQTSQKSVFAFSVQVVAEGPGRVMQAAAAAAAAGSHTASLLSRLAHHTA
jgi:hypothetical protein